MIPFSAFPISLAEQQIAYMAHPDSFVPTYTGNPIGTGPFKVKSWQVERRVPVHEERQLLEARTRTVVSCRT